MTYTRRQEHLIDKGMVEVMYIISKREHCSAVMGYEYFVNWGNAVKRAKNVLNIRPSALVNDFAGRCESFTK